MSGRNRFERAITQSVSRKKDKPLRFSGTLGIVTLGAETVQVPTRSNYVWVRLRNASNEVIQAFNQTVAPVYNLPVLVERDENSPNRYTVIGRDIGRYSDWGNNGTYEPAHAAVHSFNPDDIGADITYIYSQQFMPLNLYPSGSAGSGNVIISGYTYYWEGDWRYGGGTGTANFLPLKPTDGQARLVLVYLDPNGNPAYVTGSFFSSTYDTYPEILPYIPSLPETAGIPLAAIYLTSGTSVISWDNIFDLRPLIVGDGFIPTGSSALQTPQYVTMAASASLDNERVLTPGLNVTVTDNGAGSTVLVGVTTGTFSYIGHTHGSDRYLLVYDDSTFKVSGTAASFDRDLEVSATGVTAYIGVPTGTFSRPGHIHSTYDLIVYDDGSFKATGTAIDFGSNLDVSVTGTTIFVVGSGGSFGGSNVPVFDDGQFKVTGSAIDFGPYLDVTVSGTRASITFSANMGGDLTGSFPNPTVMKLNGIPVQSGTPSNSQILIYNQVNGQWQFGDQTGGGSGGSNVLAIFDDSVFKVTGSAISFDSNLDVSVTGSIAYVNSSGGSALLPQWVSPTIHRNITDDPDSYGQDWSGVTVNMNADERIIANGIFIIPSNYGGETVTIKAAVRFLDTGEGGNAYLYSDANYGTEGETPTNHFDAYNGGSYFAYDPSGITAGQYAFILSYTLSTPAIGDIVNLSFERRGDHASDTFTHEMYFYGWKIEYS